LKEILTETNLSRQKQFVKEPSLKQGEKAMDHMDVEIKSEACEKYNNNNDRLTAFNPGQPG